MAAGFAISYNVVHVFPNGIERERVFQARGQQAAQMRGRQIVRNGHSIVICAYS